MYNDNLGGFSNSNNNGGAEERKVSTGISGGVRIIAWGGRAIGPHFRNQYVASDILVPTSTINFFFKNDRNLKVTSILMSKQNMK